jgi:hypothetical protein
MRSNSRIGRGWRLAKDSWGVLRRDRSLALFPIVGTLTSLAAIVIVFAPGVAIGAAADSVWPFVPFALVGLYLATFATIYAGVGLAAAAAAVMDGKDVTLRDGLRAARARRGLIAKWALVQTTVGVILNLLQGLANSDNGIARLIGTIVIALAGAAWTVATFFVIPLLAFEGVGPKAALKRSIGIVRERWGEGVVGSASIGGIVFLVGFVPGGLLIAGGIVLGGAGGIVLAVLGALVLLVAAVVGNALSAIFRVALYRFAISDRADAGFAAQDLAGAFHERRRRGRDAEAAATG